jgi:hypothetical protein
MLRGLVVGIARAEHRKPLHGAGEQWEMALTFSMLRSRV